MHVTTEKGVEAVGDDRQALVGVETVFQALQALADGVLYGADLYTKL
jgi:hypothetical protein